jgi:hypothetical protein
VLTAAEEDRVRKIETERRGENETETERGREGAHINGV